MLSVESLRSGYTSIDVLRGVSLEVPERAIVGVLGPNGAGKPALLRAISRLTPARGGSIRLDGIDITGASSDAVVRLGVVHVPQGRMLFGPMTVRENLELGAHLQRDRGEIRRRLLHVEALFPILPGPPAQPPANPSGGEQRWPALGRPRMASPRLRLPDEPSLG